jgi:hypothetical protein
MGSELELDQAPELEKVPLWTSELSLNRDRTPATSSEQLASVEAAA